MIVNGRSDYPIGRGNIAMTLDFVEPKVGQRPLIPMSASPKPRFITPARLLISSERWLIRTGPKSGFYFDVFRSRASESADSFHDYLYHNIGQSLSVADASGAALPLSPSNLLTSQSGYLKGYNYFKNERSLDYTGDFHATFGADISHGPRRMMSFWMTGQKDRHVFAVDAPANHAVREFLPAAFSDMPMPTVIVRQNGDAWRRPFIAIYEPYLESDGPMIQSIRSAKVEGDDPALAACVVQGADSPSFSCKVMSRAKRMSSKATLSKARSTPRVLPEPVAK